MLTSERSRQSPSSSGTTRREVGVVVGLTLVALALCLWRIDGRSLWLDEAFSVTGSNALRASARDRGGSMIAYYLFIRVWADTDSSLLWLRLPSACFAAGSVPLLYLVGSRTVGRRAALIAAALLAISPGLIRYGQEARSYALVVLLVTLSWWLLILALERDRSWVLSLAWGASATAATYCHPLAVLAILAQGVAVAAHRPLRLAWRRVRAGLLVVIVGHVPIALVARGSPGAAPAWIEPLNLTQLDGLRSLLFGSFVLSSLALGALAAGGTVLLATSAVGSERHDRWRRLLPVAWFWVPIVTLVGGSLVRPYLEPRYLLLVLPAGCLLAAVTLDRLRPMALAVVAVVILVGAAAGIQRVWDGAGQPWGDAVALMTADSDGATGVALVDPWARNAFEYALIQAGVEDRIVPVDPGEPWGTMDRYTWRSPIDEVVDRLDDLDELWLVHWRHSDRPWFEWLVRSDLADHVTDGFCLTHLETLEDTLVVARLASRAGEECGLAG